ncbi:hypothetical protein ACH9EU_05640 [Kocuria sp. M1R5S2]|uniref:hypothetical protein n=1 Tax=Kocuria rhizosphaerae TaxID=3376285 RepID=UPI0037A0B8DC
MADYVPITPEAATSRAELQIAQAVGARVSPAVLPATIGEAGVLGHLRAVNGSPVRATRFGADPSDLAAAVVPILAPVE